MTLHLGNNANPSKLYVGNQEVQKVYKGSEEVWSQPVIISGGALVVDRVQSQGGNDLDIDISFDNAGTLYYGFYPTGTTVDDVTVTDLVAGTDTGLVSSGTAGVFLALGVLSDITINTSAVEPVGNHVIVFVVDVDDAGSYSNLVLETY